MKKITILLLCLCSVTFMFGQDLLRIGVLNDKESAESEPLFQKLKADIIGVVGQFYLVIITGIIVGKFINQSAFKKPRNEN